MWHLPHPLLHAIPLILPGWRRDSIGSRVTYSGGGGGQVGPLAPASETVAAIILLPGDNDAALAAWRLPVALAAFR